MLEKLLQLEKNLDHVLAFSKVISNTQFQDYIMSQNSTIAETQITALQRILEFIKGDAKKLKINKDEVAEKCLVNWKLKEVTEEEQKESFREEFQPEVPKDTVRVIKSEMPIDISGIANIVNRGSSSVKMKSFARKQPEQIAPERSLDLQKQFKPEEQKAVSDLRFFRAKGSKKQVKK
jgi:hypothetical protein